MAKNKQKTQQFLHTPSSSTDLKWTSLLFCQDAPPLPCFLIQLDFGKPKESFTPNRANAIFYCWNCLVFLFWSLEKARVSIFQVRKKKNKEGDSEGRHCSSYLKHNNRGVDNWNKWANFYTVNFLQLHRTTALITHNNQ